ncbi:hypothetical protein [Paraburkholderia sediminicola]|uniref:hypothetical protein n=1 Tax=Paraburkholderia sediminicola TaxID=458836 RepID=UPI0038BA4D50
MNITQRKKLSIAFGFVATLTACGGGHSGSSSSSSNTPTLSADQTAFQSFALTPNQAYRTDWNLPASGKPVSATNYFVDSYSSLAASPGTGTQKVTNSALASIATTLPIPAAASLPERYLVAGNIVIGSGPAYITNISYQGTGVRADTLAVDGATTVDSKLRTNISVVPLSGTVASAPTDLVQWFNFLYFNTALLNTTTAWAAGASYMKYTETEIGDMYTVEDYNGATTGASPVPVATGTTIAALMAAGGIGSGSDGTTYTLGNGTVSTIKGVNTYVATAVRPDRTTPTYHTYYDLNGNVYTGNLVKDGTVIGGDEYPVAAPGTTSGYTLNYSQNFQIRLNTAAITSLQGAVTF